MTVFRSNYKSKIRKSDILRHASRKSRHGFSMFDKIKNLQLCSFQLKKSEKNNEMV